MTMRTKLAASAFGLVALLASGCGSPAPAAASNPDRARATLRAVLDLWKAGSPADAAAKLSPPVYVADEDWTSGAKLEDYGIESGDHGFGTGLRCPVSLTFKDPKTAKPRKRKALYIVTTEPVLRVDRQDAP